jgi:hypothetical protein
MGMRTLDELAAILAEKWTPWTCSWYPSKPATEESIARIESTLKFTIPRDFVEFSRMVHNYGVWFGSIGDDYASDNHLLRLNEEFHQVDGATIALPEHWVLINHGHDGDCECFDVSAIGTTSEYPIYYINVISPGQQMFVASSFREYLDKLG